MVHDGRTKYYCVVSATDGDQHFVLGLFGKFDYASGVPTSCALTVKGQQSYSAMCDASRARVKTKEKRGYSRSNSGPRAKLDLIFSLSNDEEVNDFTHETKMEAFNINLKAFLKTHSASYTEVLDEEVRVPPQKAEPVPRPREMSEEYDDWGAWG
jgi:hypothetical protein